MFYKKMVPVPQVSGKVIFHPLKGVVYVQFEIHRSYSPKGKYNTPTRVNIGKLIDKNDRSRMFPNERYFELFPEEGRVDLEDKELEALQGQKMLAALKKSGKSFQDVMAFLHS